MALHPSITLERIEALVRADQQQGLCLQCGAEVDNVEPDARRYPCPVCEARRVYGAEQLLLMLAP